VNPFKVAWRGTKKVATAPVRAVRNTKRLLAIRREAEDWLLVAEEAEADPRLYRDVAWWGRLLKEARDVWNVLPVAKEMRNVKLIIEKVVRHGLGSAGAWLMGNGYLSMDQWEQGIGAVVMLVTLAWSIVPELIRRRKATA
jgi:hypothetical protein